jgi:hypothetical protein
VSYIRVILHANIFFGLSTLWKAACLGSFLFFKVTCYSSTSFRGQADNPVSSFSASPETSLKYTGVVVLLKHLQLMQLDSSRYMDWKIPYVFMEVLLCIAVTRMSSYYWLFTSNRSV